jgi:hypothetical protein
VPASSVPDGWFCFQDVDLGSESAPCVVAGVRGVFTVDAYATADRVSSGRSGLAVSGRPASDLIDIARRRATALEAAIGAPVNPLIAFEANEVEAGWSDDVQVAALGNLRSLLLHMDGRRTSWDELKRVRAVLRHLAT